MVSLVAIYGQFVFSGTLTIPQFRIHALQVEQLAVRPRFHYLPILQHEDLVAVTDGAQSMRHKHTRTTLLLQDAIDVLQERLFCVGVQGRCLGLDQLSSRP